MSNVFFVAFGRSGYLGLGQALASRYTNLSLYFIVATLCLSALALYHYCTHHKITRDWHGVFILLVISFIVGYMFSYHQGIRKFRIRKYYVGLVADKLYDVDKVSDDLLRILHPDPALVRRNAKTLIKMGYL